jgi:hypothetical protein
VRRLNHYLVLILAVLLTSPLGAVMNQFPTGPTQGLFAQSFWIDSLGWKAFCLECQAGDSLAGEFKLIQDGNLFIGDQTKYDNWLQSGIDFFICCESHYASWTEGEPMESITTKLNVNRLIWDVSIPTTGKWFIVYYNPSIYMKQIEGSYYNASAQALASIAATTLAVILLVLAGLALRYGLKKRNP